MLRTVHLVADFEIEIEYFLPDESLCFADGSVAYVGPDLDDTSRFRRRCQAALEILEVCPSAGGSRRAVAQIIFTLRYIFLLGFCRSVGS